jgi:hypothetical protein
MVRSRPMTEQKFKPGSLLKRAFLNQYNAILLGTSGLFAATTQSWLPLLVGGGMEVLWLVLGPDTALFKRWVLAQESEAEKERLEARTTDALQTLDPWYLQRYQRLQSTSSEIGQLSKENQSIENELLEVELGKIGSLLSGYLKMAVVHQRLGRFLSENQRPHIERDIEHCQRALAHEKNARLRGSLQQALDLARRRLEQQEQLDASYKSLGVEMDTLEKSLGFLKSRVLNLSSREELGAELDTLVSGVGTIDELDRETDKMLAELRTARVAGSRAAARA